jgi:hypothetical protein
MEGTMLKALLAGAVLILGMVSVEAAQKSAVAPGAYDAMAEQQIKCNRRGCRTLRPGCRIVARVTKGKHVVCSKLR